MIDNADILVEVLTGFRVYEYKGDKDKYLTDVAMSDAKALTMLCDGNSDGAIALKGNDEVFMLAVGITNRIYELVKADCDDA